MWLPFARPLCLPKTPIYVRKLELCLFFVLSRDAYFSSDTPCHRVFDRAFARCPGIREPGSPAPNRRSSTLRTKASQVDSTGPSAVGLALPRLERLALGAGHRPSTHSSFQCDCPSNRAMDRAAAAG